MSRVLFSIIAMTLVIHYQCPAQEVRPVGKFLEDSVRIGMPVHYSLAIRSPKGTKLLLPDSTYDFRPFEYNGLQFSPTVSREGISYDSVVYELLSFEVDTFQTLALPVFLIQGKDSTKIEADTDSLAFSHTVLTLPKVPEEQVVLKEDTVFRQIALRFNYPYLLIGSAILFTLGLMLYLSFGKKLVIMYRLHRLKKQHEAFLSSFRFSDRPDGQESNTVLLQWKKYMEQLEGLPYTKLSTKEMALQRGTAELSPSLKTIDRTIYGGHQDEHLAKSFAKLREFSNAKFKQKAVQIKNG